MENREMSLGYLYEEENGNIVLLPTSLASERIGDEDNEYAYLASLFPICICAPYSIESLARAIETVLGKCNRFMPYRESEHKSIVIEQLLFHGSTFTEAMRGKRFYKLCKNGRKGTYIEKKYESGKWLKNEEITELSDEAQGTDFAQAFADISVCNAIPFGGAYGCF